ncbi:antA/AntB antirepressor family protein [Methylovulum psychrotolerans]|nr:antA/AntB antirepressor family protein [Methylovulum psychrotolerans]
MTEQAQVAPIAQESLVPVFSGEIAGLPAQLVDARALHKFLGSKQLFQSWFKKRIAAYGFLQDIDFIAIQKNIAQESKTYGQDKLDYHLTLDMAKELGMVERNEKGRQIRRYFIDCEAKLWQQQLAQPTPPDLSGLAGLIRAEIARALPKADPLLPPDQAAAINHSLERLSRLFHPLSAPFADVLSLTRALHGLDTTYGMPHPDYQTLLIPAEPDPSVYGGQPVPPTPSPTGYSRVLLYVTHNGQVERSETLPDTMCLVSIKNADTVVNFINYLLPEALLPDLLKAASQRMFRLMALRG